MVSGLRKDANLEQGLTWGKHCPGATPASENSSESLWEGPEPALPVLCSPRPRSSFLCRPPRVFALPESWHLESPELKSLFGTVLSHSLVLAVFQGALPKSLSHARSCFTFLFPRTQYYTGQSLPFPSSGQQQEAREVPGRHQGEKNPYSKEGSIPQPETRPLSPSPSDNMAPLLSKVCFNM